MCYLNSYVIITNGRDTFINFRKLLESGASKNWQELLGEAIGEKNLNASAIVEYFTPLTKYMKDLREKEGYPIGWSNTAYEKFYE